MTLKPKAPRIAARAIIIQNNALLMVNAFANSKSDLWCAPGGGVEPHSSLPENLIREIHEETGLTISVQEPCLVNEFHDPHGTFHQIDIYFRCTILAGDIDPNWRDPEKVVTKRRFFTREALKSIRYKPDSLPEVAFSPEKAVYYDALEPIVR
jgi:8-oxo-dGTP pyrophosphatase MutT (NUDIX family)